MRPRSLRLRLGLAAAALVALALALAAVGLVLIFDHVLDRHAAADLDRTARLIAGQVRARPEGPPRLASEPPDPRFVEPYGGLYWQVGTAGGEIRSRSLWDKRLDVPAPPGTAPAGRLDLPGPDGGRLLAVALPIVVGRHGEGTQAVIVVAMDRRDLAASRGTYLGMLVPSVVALGLVLASAMALFVHLALAPFRALRADLGAVHAGTSDAMGRSYPDEVQPLVDDLNRLLERQSRHLRRAREQAGDMAHGLKTSLAVLTALARRLADDRPDLSREIDEQAQAMNRQVERSLTRARLAADRRLVPRACPVAPVVARLVAALRRLPDADSLSWDLSVDPTLAFPGSEGDLLEILGNLVDNARKWAHREVSVRGAAAGGRALLAVDDDGPGMAEEAMALVERGKQWDETKPGTGFGIAIASDVAEENGAHVALARSARGGLSARLTWPTPT